ncbi:MAG: hypothetical protein V3T47_03515 [Gammaproteobacteria bacterium]
MNTIRVIAVAILTLTGFAAVQADEVVPAWRTDGFIMEEVVVTAKAPDYSFIGEIVVTVVPPQIDVATVATQEVPEIEVTPIPVTEEIVASAHSEDDTTRLATRLRNLRDLRHF